MKKYVVLMSCLAFLFLCAESAQAVIINLNDFYPGGNVMIASDGSSATMTEDPDYNSALLSDDPFYGASYPGVYLSDNATTLTFEYSFTEPAGNVDEFYAFLYDLNSYGTPLADRNNTPLEFLADQTGSGTVIWDLSGASFLGTTVGMEFQLNWAQGDQDPSSDLTQNSSVVISNVNVNPVPEPSTLLLVGSGICGLLFARRRKVIKK